MSDENQETTAIAKAGRCAIVGRPNVGKSTLLNALLGEKLVIATNVPGTTRSSVLGVYGCDEPPTQIAFMDTPGLHRPKSALGKVLLAEAKAGLLDADVLIFMVEARTKAEPISSISESDERALALVRETGKPCILVVNKVDKVRNKSALLPQLQSWLDHHPFAAIIPASALKGVGLDGILTEIRARLPEGVLYPPDFLTDRPERFFAAELVREAILQHTRADIPQGVAVTIDEFIDEGKLTRITASVIVDKKSHKGIVIGAGGQMLKAIGTSARESIEAFVQRKVFLKLWVKVVPGWTQDSTRAREFVGEAER